MIKKSSGIINLYISGLTAVVLLLAPVSSLAVSANAATPAQNHAAVCPGPAGKDSARCHARVVVDSSGQAKAASAPAGYGPLQFQTAYGLTGNSTQTIAIVDAYDDPNIKSDLDFYNKQFGLPVFPNCATSASTSCFLKLDQRGGVKFPQANAGWALEISLDVEVAHASCPSCKILLIEADSNSFANLLAAEDRAVTLGANVVSNSWGGGETSGEAANDSHFNHPGVAFTVSSGDAGYGVEYPASSPFVTAVGGTSLNLNLDGSYKNETVWSGAGSGCSVYESKPSWQTDPGCAKRTVADVSADADPNTGAAVYDSVRYQGRAGWFKVGGTSLAAPLIAVVYALAGNASLNSANNAYPYSHTSSLHDVTVGSNGTCGGLYLCTAQPGYDGPSGLGTPSGLSGF